MLCPVQIQCNWESLGSIIDHWGQYGSSLQPFAGPGHWHDMDMLLIGNACVTHDEEMTQMVRAAEPCCLRHVASLCDGSIIQSVSFAGNLGDLRQPDDHG